jgi:hypothetical protein
MSLAVTSAALSVLVAGCAAPGNRPAASSPAPKPGRSAVASARESAALVHIFLIVMENHAAGQIIGSPAAPYINALASRYALATAYSALFHPSLPNYIALTSGSNQGITDDRSPPSAGYAVNAVNIADRVQASGRTWKQYGESMPSSGYANDTALYATRHVPFLYYKDVLDNAARLKSHVVPFAQLAADLKSAGTTPDYAFITPNLCDDMHDCSVAAGDKWLSRVVPAILRSPAFTTSRSLLVITWDEGTASDNRVATILAGSGARLGYRSARPFDHYSLLHTIEAAWGLKPLTANDARAATMRGFLRR